jgi:hypothetical protein
MCWQCPAAAPRDPNALAPLSELPTPNIRSKFNWHGNVAPPDSKFVCDGHTLLPVSAITEAGQAEKLAATQNENYSGTITEKAADDLWSKSVNGAVTALAEVGQKLDKSKELPEAFFSDADGNVTVVNANIIKYVQRLTGADSWMANPDEKAGIVGYRGTTPVALVMPRRYSGPAVDTTAAQAALNGETPDVASARRSRPETAEGRPKGAIKDVFGGATYVAGASLSQMVTESRGQIVEQVGQPPAVFINRQAFAALYEALQKGSAIVNLADGEKYPLYGVCITARSAARIRRSLTVVAQARGFPKEPAPT